MRIMIAASGTAGHIHPAIAIANTIKEHEPSSEIVFVGTTRGMENDIVPKHGYNVFHLESYGFQRRITLKNFKALWTYVAGPAKAKKLIQEFQPDFVLGMGGYFSWPLLKAASSLKIPCGIHESNAINGRAVKALKNKVNRVYHGFYSDNPSTKSKNDLFSGNPTLTNNTISEEERKLFENIQKSDKRLVLVFGGSLGANSINDTIAKLQHSFLQDHPDVLLLHVTGKKKYDSVSHNEINERYIVKDFLYQMSSFESLASVIVSRSGAMTITEITNFKKPSILIPYPKSVNNHQLRNAEFLTQRGAAILINDIDLNSQALREALDSILNSDAQMAKMIDSIPSIPMVNPTEVIYKDIVYWVTNPKTKHDI